MKNLSLLLALFASVSSLAAPAVPPSAASQKVAFHFDRLPVNQLVMVYWDQCEKKGFVIDPALNKLDEVLTLKSLAMTCPEIRPLVLEALSRAGVAVDNRGTYDLLKASQVDPRQGWQEFIYRPKFRDAVELADMALIAVNKGTFAHRRQGIQIESPATSTQTPDTGTNGASMNMKHIDKLVFFGPPGEVSALSKLLARLDVLNPQVEIKAGIYEYQRGDSEGSAINAALKLFNSKLGVTMAGGASSSVGTSIKLALPNLDAVLSLLDQDSRFKYVSRPKVLAKDGESVRFFAGEDIRVVGAITLDRNGNPLQSKETLSAGITLEATPKIRGEVVDVALYQAVSNFQASGNGDPTLMKRDLRTRLVMQPGNVYIIGGVTATRDSRSGNRFFGLPIGHNSDKQESEVLLLLSVDLENPVEI